MTNVHELSARLADLLRREHAALAEFLLALAEFDEQRLWEQLGHPSLFSFLHRELGLSKGAAFYRKTAAELVRRFPELVAPLRDGRLCITSIVELAKVLTAENRGEVLPRFFHRSKQEAKAVAAELRPDPAPPRREAVTRLALPKQPIPASVRVADVGGSSATPNAIAAHAAVAVQPVEPVHANSPDPSWAVVAPRALAPTESPAAANGPDIAHPLRLTPRDTVEPRTADLRRLHVTVSRRFLDKLDAARDALGHARPGASTEDVLETALDLLLATHARRTRAAVKAPRAPAKPAAVATQPTHPGSEPAPAGATNPAPSAATRSPRHIPASVRREVWARDQGRCQWPLDSGGVCGSTHRLELDHVVPVARGGSSTTGNLRILCGFHNRLAARRAFGEEHMARFAARAKRHEPRPAERA